MKFSFSKIFLISLSPSDHQKTLLESFKALGCSFITSLAFISMQNKDQSKKPAIQLDENIFICNFNFCALNWENKVYKLINLPF